MSSLYNAHAPKKPTNVTVNADLLAQAKEMKINISATLECALTNALREKKTKLWKEENSAAIASYNETIEEFGLFSEGIRTI